MLRQPPSRTEGPRYSPMSSSPATTDERLGRVLRLLQGAIRAAGATQTEVDEAIQRRRGYLSHVFQRRVDLKLIDLLRALEVLRVDPHRFFQLAFSSRAEPAVSSVLTECFDPEQLGESGNANLKTRATEDPSLLERVRGAVRDLLAEIRPPSPGREER